MLHDFITNLSVNASWVLCIIAVAIAAVSIAYICARVAPKSP